jgi:phospholipid/cholesterol/gamma-HCH transport system substrate-binding protein
MKIRDVATFVAFGLMIATAVGYIGALGVRVSPPSHRTRVSMAVADINSLNVDSKVLLRGVPVGTVTDITSSVEGATIGFYIDGRFQVPVDTDVRLENLSALGETYIGLVPKTASGPMLQDGQHIATQRVIAPASISELAVSAMRVLNQADPDALKRIVDEADTALPDPNSVLPNLSRTSVLIRNVVTDMRGRGSVLLDNFQTLLRNAGWLGPLLADIGPGIDTIGTGAGGLFAGWVTAEAGGSPQIDMQFNRLFDRLLKFLDDSGADFRVLGEALKPQLKGIAGALMNFDTGQILAHVLETVPADGAITLHVTIPPK